jgi:hypothetical protein
LYKYLVSIFFFQHLAYRTTSQRNNATALKPFGNKQMKSKFQNFDFGAVEVLSREEQSRVKGGAYGNPSNGGGCLGGQTQWLDPKTGELKSTPCWTGNAPHQYPGIYSGIIPYAGAYH